MEHRAVWNAFISQAINGTFLFHRDFMEYHRDRFVDASLLVYDKDLLVCCVPGNISGETFYSHQGLTYGGFVLLENTSQLESIVLAVLNHLESQQLTSVVFNMQLSYYNFFYQAIQELLLAQHFAISRELCNMQLHLTAPVKISNKKTAGYRNGAFDDLSLRIEFDFSSFWEQVLVPQLAARHKVKPVHTLEEITSLAAHFPTNIKQYNVYREQELLAGATFFLHGTIAKSQYAATAPAGRTLNAMDFLYIEAMQDLKDAGFTILDYGPVNERDGSINRGVQRFKEELGCEQETVLQFTKIRAV